MNTVDSSNFFKWHWVGWRYTGIYPIEGRFAPLYIIYGVISNIIFSIFYPLHLGMSLFRNETRADDIRNFAVLITTSACSIKFFIYSRNLQKVREIDRILATLDVRVCSAEDRSYYRKIGASVRNIIYLFTVMYFLIGSLAELSFLLREERGLLYPAWVPFDWHNSTRNFYLVHAYQVTGIFFLLLQNFADDSYPPMMLCLLAGHIKLLGMRMSRIGHNCDDLQENEKELQRCINDQKNLYRLFDTIQEVISLPMFVQFLITAANVCLAMAALFFYVYSPIDRLYCLVYFVAMPMQIFPTCYYGSLFQELFGKLQYEIFRCDWTQQTKCFKKNMILLSERARKETTGLAGGMIRIHLDTFLSSIKGAYSFFTVIMNMK